VGATAAEVSHELSLAHEVASAQQAHFFVARVGKTRKTLSL
jgi:hypothetical protein